MNMFRINKKALNTDGVGGMDSRIYLPLHRAKQLEDTDDISIVEMIALSVLMIVAKRLSDEHQAYTNFVRSMHGSSNVHKQTIDYSRFDKPEAVFASIEAVTNVKPYNTVEGVSLYRIVDLPYDTKHMVYSIFNDNPISAEVLRQCIRVFKATISIGSDFNIYIEGYDISHLLEDFKIEGVTVKFVAK